MAAEPNPYESPLSPPDDPRPQTTSRWAIWATTFFVGSVLGVLCFFAAIAMIPADVANPSVHDLALANNLGFIYPVVVGLWSAWIRRSRRWAVVAVVSGLVIGVAYYLLCDYNFLAVMVAFPCLLGGVASLVLGNGRPSWINGALQRLGKGLLAGFV